MNAKTLAPLGIAAVLGLAAAFVARNMLAQRPAQSASAETSLRTVVVANTNILPGSEIDPSAMLITAKVSAEMAPEGTFSEAGELQGRVTQAPIYKGQPVMATLLAPKGSAGGLQALVPKGMRAITLAIDEYSGVGGFLTPGCRVDVLSTVQGEKGGEMVARTVVENVLVTAVGQRMTLTAEKGQERPSASVTIIATPDQAKLIELAAATGRPRLVLRNPRDEAAHGNRDVALSELRSGANASAGGGFLAGLFGANNAPRRDPFATQEPTAAVEAAVPATQPSTLAGDAPTEPRYWTVRIIRAGNESQVQFPLDKAEEKPSTLPGPLPGVNRQHEPITRTDDKPVAAAGND